MQQSEWRNILATLLILVVSALAFFRPFGCGKHFLTPPVYEPKAELIINARPKHPTGLATDALSQKGRRLLSVDCQEGTVLKVLGPPLVRWQDGKVLVYATAGVSYDWREGDVDGRPVKYLMVELDSEARVNYFEAHSAEDLPAYYPNEKLPPINSMPPVRHGG